LTTAVDTDILSLDFF